MSETTANLPLPPQYQPLIDASLAHARQAQALREQILVKAPQLAAVLELLDQQAEQDTEDAEDTAHQAHEAHKIHGMHETTAAAVTTQRSARGSGLLDMTAGLLANTFPIAAPLFHGCRAFLQFKLLHKKAG